LSPSRRIKAAILGTGGIAEVAHLPALRAQAHRVDVVAAVDIDPERLAAFTSKHEIPAGYTSLDAMLAEQRPDLVHVCTPPAAHADAVVRILEEGSWALVEKPPTLSLAEFDRIERAERDGGPYASVVYQHRFGSGGLRLARQAAVGELGRALVAQCETSWFRGHGYYEVPWRGRWATEGGGPTMGHGIHQMDLLLAVLGEWTEVRAVAGRLDRDIETEDVSLALVRFASGALATVVNSVLSPREESRLRFDFTDATVELRHLYGYHDADWRYTPAPHVADSAERIAAWSADPGGSPEGVGSSHAAQLPYVLDALERGERPPTSGAAGRETLELVTAIYRAAFTGQNVTRGQIGPEDPFYHRLHGDVPGWAPKTADAGSGRPQATVPRQDDEAASTLVFSADGTEILRYHAGPRLDAYECVNPYFHPLRTLRGAAVTGNRPNDHRWHKGLAMTASHLSGQNFWGGASYVSPKVGYRALPNVGRMEHQSLDRTGAQGAQRFGFTGELDWITAEGETWIRERRAASVRDVDREDGSWALEFATELRNVRGEDLEFGSPTVFGRELAGYCGFFWRGPRAFTGGTVRASQDRTGQSAAMGHTSPWLAFTGEFDDVDGFATLLFVPDPGNPGGEPYWFVRSEPFAAVNPSLAYYSPRTLPPGETLRLRYRLVIADGDWDHDRIAAYLEGHPW
jgi:predicted dehydrogenase